MARTASHPEHTPSTGEHPAGAGEHITGPREHAAGPGVRATVFGLDVYSRAPLALLGGSTANATGRRLSVEVQAADTALLPWPTSATLVSDDHQPDGSLIYQIEMHPTAGYLLSGPGFGGHLLAGDGTHLRCAPGDRPDAAWQRLLIAQVLPFAALLHGLEVFHASAVVWGERAVALLGPSRAGKTSLALELCRRGARFLADDVLALERREGRLLAHPGTPVAGVAHAEAATERVAQRFASAQTVAVNARERLIRVPTAIEPAPLGTLLFLDRRASGPARPCFEPVTEAQMLLTATFNFVLATPARLHGLLEVCALAARLRVERVLVGPGAGVPELGAAIERRLDCAP